ncbi:stage V sporulation protein D (sporulation-specific penicillin-binding protein) [Anaerocolumna jejuensis DSM 15929]|uniref:Stage V sporulation protein D (Sporulation-specific penicillin-binding protein) n=1 Tax=Anaerocolumna jejuensis DSM 15929 TaxID=1121322 RepID=A0A1M6NIF3_9FIRM|nr:penicillin-binding transpeptidase domain-containing protein [Anaerocolumna jejuensis]SHJ95416.1 stage V sporulation protein D (sporulation-specific penicillin-binding protein) [Anaerocolumna jejuensis DSM 15929]
MARNKTFNRRNVLIVVSVIIIAAVLLTGRLAYLMIVKSADYAKRAEELHERERAIKAERGIIYDRNGVVLADNKPVSTISVIHSQITDPEKVIKLLSETLGLSEAKVRKRVEKKSSIERVKSNVDKAVADSIRELNLDGVMVDEDYKRYYPYGDLASKVIGFTGSDNQGIIGLEVEYDKYLKGTDGTILTLTTANGVEIENAAEDRIEPVAGKDLVTSLDVNIQKYAEQAALKVMEAKNAKNVKMILMNPQDGTIYACVNVPEFNLNEPYTLTDSALNGLDPSTLTDKQKNDLLNNMWRNASISDTYEPGSTFKVVTATAALEEKVVKLTDRFFCPGYKVVEDRRIRCHKAGGHGSEDFIDGIKNSCNPVFIEVGARVGVTNMYKYYSRLGLMRKTGVDLPGEARSIMHKTENVGAVELATMSFGQSFQITPLQLLVAASAVVNGGKLVTPHFGVEIKNKDGSIAKTLKYKEESGAVTKETSDLMKQLLEMVVSEGSGKRAYLAGYHIGGKTATSEKLPRSSNKYISSFLGFAPADNPQIIGIVLIDEPVGIYYGGTIAAPVIAEVYEDALPYLGIQPTYTEEEIKKNNIGTMRMPDLAGMSKAEVKKMLKDYTFKEVYYDGEGDKVKNQFPLSGEEINNNSNLILYME